jgi:5-methylcytosine-specific restriction endonuclease McrA
MAVSKRRNGGEWTEARYRAFIKGGLRSVSDRWPPRYKCLNAAKVGKRVNKASGRLAEHYRCAKCLDIFPLKEVEVNHIIPVIPTSGFTTWDDTIERMFCEQIGLEILCKPCHKLVTKQENEERANDPSKRI